jgi:quinoprotein glucose dehydrogenase
VLTRFVAIATTFLALGATGCDTPPIPPTAAEAGASVFDATLPRCSPETGRAAVVDTLATGLEVPWDLTFLSDGSALLTERPGRIRRVGADGTVDPDPWAEIDALDRNEVGLMGIDAHQRPDGSITVFVAVAIDLSGPPGPMARVRGLMRRMRRAFDRFDGAPRRLDVLAYDLSGPEAEAPEPRQVLSMVPLGELHGGGALRIGDDDLLYLSNGDGAAPAESQDPRSAGGKVLRFTLDGVPAPLSDGDEVPAVLSGLRNPQAFGWHPSLDRMVVLEHGPSGIEQDGGRVGNDELNVASLGDNLGWPVVAGLHEGGPFRSPAVEWTSSIAPGGLAVRRDTTRAGGGAAYVTGLRDGVLRKLTFDAADPSSVACEEPILDGGYGRLRLVAEAPDGSLWVGTSNRDRRGGPRPGDDLLLRVPAMAPENDS